MRSALNSLTLATTAPRSTAPETYLLSQRRTLQPFRTLRVKHFSVSELQIGTNIKLRTKMRQALGVLCSTKITLALSSRTTWCMTTSSPHTYGNTANRICVSVLGDYGSRHYPRAETRRKAPTTIFKAARRVTITPIAARTNTFYCNCSLTL